MKFRSGPWLAYPIVMTVAMIVATKPLRAQTGCGQGAGQDITVTNLAQNETVGYELLLIKGNLGATADGIHLDQGPVLSGSQSAPPEASDGSGAPKAVRDWPAGGGRFKALVHLKRGQNRIMLSAEGHKTFCLDVNYSPNPSANRIRVVFVLAQDGSEGAGVIPGPPGDISDLPSAKKRLAFGALLLETAMAELLHDAGRSRRTVNFKRDSRGLVEVTVFHSAYKDVDLRTKTPDQLWETFHDELDSAFQDGRTIFLSMLGGFGGGALGGGSQAMFGTSTLYSWAQDLGELTNRFSDERKPGDFQLEDESGFRNAFWANYSTGIGATMHELGHALGLPHSGDGNDIMERGFDRFNRIFMIKEEGALITDEAVRYSPSSADRLFQSPWVLPSAPAGVVAKARRNADLTLGRIGNRITLSASASGPVTVDLFAPDGVRAARLFMGTLAAGEHGFTLPRLTPGLYFCAVKRETAADGATGKSTKGADASGTQSALVRIVIP